ncbi:ketoacyl-ACP synthase III [Paenibacillus silvae]|uniref:ketoacyl-ACP synthase III n=1 Tax=Paenibacillus silvae TaxID=1325358 RepID=UPI0020037712|nr:ketoacyl-ACP synthase III [Paenibacillus silvae]MCK6077613.1 ketoacyl-ACP synthase III [Paenibacillus silvae]MCK6151653.1 ketoacyl-ACP synthase III [Paenibacillus silvae]MCK6270141.1 ketoacyl-ACP synthase III [Paenibacillus silvae]
MNHQSMAAITAMGTYVPDRILSNADLEKMVDTSDEWIVQRTGMRERRIAAEHQFVSDLATEAVKDMVRRYEVNITDVDMILFATSTPEYSFPSSASRLQANLGIPHTGVLDLNAACAGFTYGMQLADSLVTSGMYRKVLVIGAETLSKITDYTDRTTCVLFGDGAGAFLVERALGQGDFKSVVSGTQGEGGMHLYKSGLSTEMNGQPLNAEGKLVQNGREVYKWAVRMVPEQLTELIAKADMSPEQIDWFVPHSANMRMIEAVCERGPIPLERTLTSMEYRGNTSAASIPLALQLAVDEGKLQHGQNVALFGFGGGLTYSGLVVRWGVPDSE